MTSLPKRSTQDAPALESSNESSTSSTNVTKNSDEDSSEREELNDEDDVSLRDPATETSIKHNGTENVKRSDEIPKQRTSKESSGASNEANSQTKLPPSLSLSTTTQKNVVNQNKQPTIGTLASLNHSTPIDCFVQLVSRERRLTKEGNPFFKATFRDSRQSTHAVLWNESPLFKDCEKNWKIGKYYKIRGLIRNTNYGSQLEILRIREVTPDDKADGFSENRCRPTSETPPEATAAEILALANQHLQKTPLLRLIQKIYKDKRLALYESPASRSHHRTYVGGLLEHTLSVTKLAVLLTDYFHATIPQTKSQLYKPLVVAGAILHDIGKILDTQMLATGPRHTLAGELVGHAILGAEIVRRYADETGVSECLKTQLIHLILTHSRFQDWGAPMQPSSLEAMILHYADYTDSTFVSSLKTLSEDVGDDAFTDRKGPFGVPLLKPTLSQFTEKNSPKTSEQDKVPLQE